MVVHVISLFGGKFGCDLCYYIFCLGELRLACLLQVFHFIYSYAVLLNIRCFTLDEFAETFHDKVIIFWSVVRFSTWSAQFASLLLVP